MELSYSINIMNNIGILEQSTHFEAIKENKLED